MKKVLRNLALATAVLVAGSASAQTLTKVWELTAGVPGSSSGGEFRFASVKDGQFIVTDKANKKIVTLDENGQADYFDLAEVIDTHYGADVVYKDQNGADSVVHEVPGAGTGITVDDAGNILVGLGFPNAASSTDFIIISADLSETYKLKLELPVTAGRIDQYGKVVGNMLSDEGAYLWLAINGASQVAIVKIVNGEQDMDYTQASANVSVTMNTSVLAQPMYFTTGEIDAFMDENGDLTPSFWSRNRGSAQTIYGWNEDATAQTTLLLTENDANGVTTKGAGAEGFATFKLGDITYFAVPMSLDGSARSAAVGVYDEKAKLQATYVPEGVATGMGQMGSVIAEVIDDYTANIYRFIPGVIAAKYTFSLPKPEPDVEPLYMVGQVNGNNWDISNPVEIPWNATSQCYEANLTIDGAEFKFSEVSGNGDWNAFNAKAICIADDQLVEYGNKAELWKYSGTNCKFGSSIEAGKEYNIKISVIEGSNVKGGYILVSESTGVENVEVEANAPAVYYNLQGVEVANPENGLYIVKQGNKVSKVLVK